MIEITIDRTVHRPKGGVWISCVLTLIGDTLSVTQAGADAIGYGHIKPFNLRKQEVSQVRLCPRLFVNGNNLFYITITGALPFLIAAMQFFYSGPNMRYLIQTVIPCISCISLLFIGLQLLCCMGWCLKFICRDGHIYLLPLAGYLIFPLQKYRRDPILELIREVKTWRNPQKS